MHLSDGILSVPVLAGGGLLAAAGVAWGLHRLDDDAIPRTALLSAVFFVASLLHLRIGPGSVHLLLNGLVGILLGWTAFPALLIGLLFQALLAGHGGLTVLGVNTVIFSVPAVTVGCLFRRLARGRPAAAWMPWGAGLGGVLAAALTVLLGAVALLFSGREFMNTARALVLLHLPVMALEGLVTGAVVAYLQRVRPSVFRLPAP